MNQMTYFLEKEFSAKSDGSIELSIDAYGFYYSIVRPCNLTYSQCIDFFTKKNDAPETLTLEAAKVILNDSYGDNYHEQVINVELRHGIVVDFIYESVCLSKISNNYNSYQFRIIDVKTGNVIVDNTEDVKKIIKDTICDKHGYLSSF